MAEKFQFYNSLTRKVDEFIPNEPGKVSMYTCGPTVYHFAHIGNIRTYIMQDVLIKSLEYAGYNVKTLDIFLLMRIQVRIRCWQVQRESIKA